MALLILAVLGSIYAGMATATEAAAFGVRRRAGDLGRAGPLNWHNFKDALMGATRLYCMIAFILAGAAFLTLTMGFIGLPRHLAEWIGSLGLSQFQLIVVLAAVLHRARLLPRRHLDGGADHGRGACRR